MRRIANPDRAVNKQNTMNQSIPASNFFVLRLNWGVVRRLAGVGRLWGAGLSQSLFILTKVTAAASGIPFEMPHRFKPDAHIMVVTR